MKRTIKFLLGFLLLGIVFMGCDKTKLYKVKEAEAQVHFTGSAIQNYAVRAANPPVYNVAVGTTDVSDVDRNVTFTVTSKTGAAAGTQYTIGAANNTVVIPAGKSTTVIPIQGIYAGYPVGRIDTLVITLTEPSVKVAGFSNTVKLAIGDICVEGIGVNINSLAGNYANTNEDFGGAYGPYLTSISNITPVTATSATIKVNNLFDAGWGPITFTLDWSTPGALTATVVPQTSGIGDAGTLNPAYAGQQVAVRPFSGQTGTWSSCYGTLTLKMQLGVTGLGYFGTLYTVNMAR